MTLSSASKKLPCRRFASQCGSSLLPAEHGKARRGVRRFPPLVPSPHQTCVPASRWRCRGASRRSISGLTRRAALGRSSRRRASWFSSNNSASDSQLKTPILARSAYSISSTVLPTPENTTFDASPPACNTRNNSPLETISNPDPARASSPRTPSDELAFYGVVNLVRARERTGVSSIVGDNRAGRIHIAGRTEIAGEVIERDLFAIQPLLSIFKSQPGHRLLRSLLQDRGKPPYGSTAGYYPAPLRGWTGPN